MADLKALVGNVLETSAFLADVKKVNEPKGKSILFGDKVRALTPAEVDVLQKQRNSSQDWNRVLVAQDFSSKNVFACYFAGDVVLGVFKKSDCSLGDGVVFPAGLYSSVIVNCEIDNDALVHEVGQLSNYVVGAGAVIANVKHLAANAGTNFGVGRELPLANEVGGRDVAIYPEITIGVAEKISKSRDQKDLIEAYGKFVADYAEKAKSKKGIIGAGAAILNTGRVVDAYVGAGAEINNANAVIKSVLLSLPEEKAKVLDGAWVSNSVIQWGSDANTMAIVDKSVVCEHAHVERHGKLTESILGPNSGVAEGEATACLLGPFVGFHHQSLLIAAMWPEGKGNVGYGANVGSNHTAKAPDQEIWCGEGTFFGLGVNIKFPANFTKAPYTIIASGVTCLPQKFDFPFSLLNSPSEGVEDVPPAYNEVFPGWVLSDNIYMVMRNEGKYKDRNKAKREKFVFDVFRPDIVDLMVDARKRLQAATGKKIYTEKEIKGLAKNYTTEEARVAGIEAYTFYLKYYALKALYAKALELSAAGKTAEIKSLVSAPSADANFEHARKVLAAEFPGQANVPELLKKLAEMQNAIAKDVQTSKEKDDKRGARIIPDYEFSHKPATADGFVKKTWASTKEMDEKIATLVKSL